MSEGVSQRWSKSGPEVVPEVVQERSRGGPEVVPERSREGKRCPRGSQEEGYQGGI